MNILKIILLFFIVPTLHGRIHAQQVRGSVRDTNGEPLFGALVSWADTTVRAATDMDGVFSLRRAERRDLLVASCIGYVPDTIRIGQESDSLNFILREDANMLEEVVVLGRTRGNMIQQSALSKTEMITFSGLTKMACCTLAESFENSASITVGYSDAVSGARQIKMLGLSGTYTQILDESRPVMQGLAAPYSLNYTPGMWLNSIQISKGVSSVAAGHGAVTGQINLEYRKPTDAERLFANFYLDDELRAEANLSSAVPVTKDGKLSTVVLLHGSLDTDWREMPAMDRNDDRFRDLPKTDLINAANKWLYVADNGMQLRWGFQLLQENRLGGMLHYKNTEAMRQAMLERWDDSRDLPLYGSHIRNRGANAYVKLAIPVGRTLRDEEKQTEVRSNIAFVADFEHFDQNAYFGLNDYRGNENSVSAHLLYTHHFTLRSSLAAGLQTHLSFYRENVLNRTPWIPAANENEYDLNRNEQETGAYAEYTYTIGETFSLVAGLRGDYNAWYKRFFVTPRGHIKWNIAPNTVLRVSAGLGYRSANAISDNIGILATGRQIIFDSARGDFDFRRFDRLEKALTVGGSLTRIFSLTGKDDATLSFDYFHTRFYNSLVVDQEWQPMYINIYNTRARSYTDTYQLDFNWTPVERLDIFATLRYTDSQMTVERPEGKTAQVERPLINQYKTLLNVQYATKFRRWVFDATAQLNGPARIPSQDGDLNHDSHSPGFAMFYAQITRKIDLFDLYAGCENIGGYRQKNPILHAENPYDYRFNSMNVWGPLMGRKFYIGFRMNLY